ncbi:MAG: hypothetical protein K9H16_11365 [Bacteroidales bacterium]|nr:hypothetical protein [Bacteroidales bacterium]
MITFLPKIISGQEIDNVFDKLPDDTVKVNLLIDLGKSHCAMDNQKALFYLQEALFLSNNLNFKKGIAYSYLWLGRVYYYKDEYDLAKTNLNKSRALLEELNDVDGLAFLHFACGSMSDLKSDFVNALRDFQEVVRLSKQAGNEQLCSAGLFSIGAIHIKRNNMREAKIYLDQSLRIKKAINDSGGIANTYNAIGKILEHRQSYDSAMFYYQKGFEIRNELNDLRGVANSEIHIGSMYIEIKDYPRAIGSLQHAFEIYVDLDEQTGQCIANTLLSLAYNNSGEKEKGWALLSQSLEEAKRLENPSLIMDCYETRAKIEAFNGNYIGAYHNANLLKSISDSMTLINREEIIQELEARYQLQNKNDQIELLESKTSGQRKNIIILNISITALFLILLLTIFLFRLKAKSHQTQKRIFEQDKTIRMQQEKINEKEMMILQESVDAKNRELAAKAIEMLRINETIGEVISSLESLNTSHNTDPKISASIKKIVGNLENQTNTNTWKEFDKIFKNIHTEFYDHLLEICPSLTASEIKIAALLKLNLSTKEIAAITYKTEDGIKSTRYRLRKKLNLSGDENLIPFLMKL